MTTTMENAAIVPQEEQRSAEMQNESNFQNKSKSIRLDEANFSLQPNLQQIKSQDDYDFLSSLSPIS